MSYVNKDEVKKMQEEIDAASAAKGRTETPEEIQERVRLAHEARQLQATPMTEGEEAFAMFPESQSLIQELDQARSRHPSSGVFPSKDQHIINDCARTGEPIFVLRAKDIFSVMAITEYYRIVELYGPEDHSFQMAIGERLQEFKQWQRENVAKVRYPD